MLDKAGVNDLEVEGGSGPTQVKLSLLCSVSTLPWSHSALWITELTQLPLMFCSLNNIDIYFEKEEIIESCYIYKKREKLRRKENIHQGALL